MGKTLKRGRTGRTARRGSKTSGPPTLKKKVKRKSPPSRNGSAGQIVRLPEHAADHVGPGLADLLCAYRYAEELKLDAWEFGIDAADLKKQGVREIDLHWFVAKEYVLCGRMPRNRSARPKLLTEAHLTKGISVILTKSGAEYAAAVLRERKKQTQASAPHEGNGQSLPIKPHWDRRRRTVTLGSVIIKELKRRADVQDLVYGSLEACGWEECIDDPLPPKGEQDRKRRLHNTVNNCNRNMRNPLIRFYTNGNGTGIRWEFVKQKKTRFTPVRH